MFLAEAHKKGTDLSGKISCLEKTHDSCSVAVLHALNEAGIPVAAEALLRGEDALLSKGNLDAAAIFALSRSRRAPVAARAHFRNHFHDLVPSGKEGWQRLLFTALAMNAEGGGAEFDVRFRDLLLQRQKEDGSWEEGSVLATSVAAIVLQLPLKRLPILLARRPAAPVRVVERPEYLKPPHESSRVKVFAREGGYLVDLIVSVDGSVDLAFFEELKRGLLGANVLLYDVTDGQMNLHRVEVLADRQMWDKADLCIAKDFYTDKTLLPHPWAHGVTMVSRRVEIVNGKERPRNPIGDWVRLPYYRKGTQDAVLWGGADEIGVVAHELCHYLFGVKDEYQRETGESYCRCIVGRLEITEMCRDGDHTDSRQALSCWSLAKALYPRLVVPKQGDCGPWDPPAPVVVFR